MRDRPDPRGAWSAFQSSRRRHVGAVTAVAVLGERRYEWCTSCRAFTVAAGTVTLLTPTGTLTIGRWAVCEVCHATPGSSHA